MLGEQVTRILVEPYALTQADAPGVVADIHAALDRLGMTAPRLQHGDGEGPHAKDTGEAPRPHRPHRSSSSVRRARGAW